VPELIDELKTLPGTTMKQFGEEIGNIRRRRSQEVVDFLLESLFTEA
jgi:hypothetical protein